VARAESLTDPDPSPRRRRLRVAHSNGDIATISSHRVTVERLPLWSVFKIALVCWTCTGVLIVGAVFVTWWILDAAGAVGNFERFVTDMTGVDEFHVLSGTILSALALLTGLFVTVATTLTVVAAEFYNVVASLLGGLEVVTREETIDLRETVVPQSTVPQSGVQQSGVGTAESNGHAEGSVVLRS
jgi:hypothetical protein